MMDASEKLSAAFEYYEAKNFDAALTLVKELQQAAPHVKRLFMFEAWIYFDQEEYIRSFDVLEKLLARFDLSLPYERFLAAQTANRLGQICDVLALTVEAVKFYRLAARFHDENPKACVAMSNAIFVANALDNFSRSDFDELYAEYKSFLTDIEPFAPRAYNHKKIRVGFLSGDFCGHSAMRWGGNLITEPDKNFFEVFCYSSTNMNDEITAFLRKAVDAWRDIGDLPDLQAAKIIRDDEIDILVDLATPKDTANSTRPTASSSATMGSSRSVRGPLALY